MEETLERQQNKDASGRDEAEAESDERQEPEGEERQEPEGESDERQEPEAEERQEPEGESDERQEAEAEERQEPEAEGEESQRRPSMRKIIGGMLAFMVLALYFVWIGNEMGSHAVSGSFEMWAIFGGIFIGVVALIAGGASMRRN